MADMRFRRLGESGLMVSVVGLGCNNFGWRIDAEGARAVVGTALDEGVNLFDTADRYGRGRSEEHLGAALKGRPRDVEAEVTPACQRFGVGLLPYFPLHSGLLTGKYRRGGAAPSGTRLSEERYTSWLAAAPWDVIEALGKFAAGRGLNLLEVAIGGLAAQPAVASVIAGATSPEQVRANAAAAGWLPSGHDLAALDALTRV